MTTFLSLLIKNKTEINPEMEQYFIDCENVFNNIINQKEIKSTKEFYTVFHADKNKKIVKYDFLIFLLDKYCYTPNIYVSKEILNILNNLIRQQIYNLNKKYSITTDITFAGDIHNLIKEYYNLLENNDKSPFLSLKKACSLLKIFNKDISLDDFIKTQFNIRLNKILNYNNYIEIDGNFIIYKYGEKDVKINKETITKDVIKLDVMLMLINKYMKSEDIKEVRKIKNYIKKCMSNGYIIGDRLYIIKNKILELKEIISINFDILIKKYKEDKKEIILFKAYLLDEIFNLGLVNGYINHKPRFKKSINDKMFALFSDKNIKNFSAEKFITFLKKNAVQPDFIILYNKENQQEIHFLRFIMQKIFSYNMSTGDNKVFNEFKELIKGNIFNINIATHYELKNYQNKFICIDLLKMCKFTLNLNDIYGQNKINFLLKNKNDQKDVLNYLIEQTDILDNKKVEIIQQFKNKGINFTKSHLSSIKLLILKRLLSLNSSKINIEEVMPKIEQEFYNMTMNLLSFQNLLNKNNKEFKYFDTESISNILNIYREINLSDNIDRSDIIKFEKMLTNFKIQENSIGISL